MNKETNILESFGASFSILKFTDYFTAWRLMNSMNWKVRKWFKNKKDQYAKGFKIFGRKYLKLMKFNQNEMRFLRDERYKYLEVNSVIRDNEDSKMLLSFLEQVEEPYMVRFRLINFIGEWDLEIYNKIVRFFYKNQLPLDPIYFSIDNLNDSLADSKVEFLKKAKMSKLLQKKLYSKKIDVVEWRVEEEWNLSEIEKTKVHTLWISDEFSNFKDEYIKVNTNSNLSKSVQEINFYVNWDDSEVDDKLKQYEETWKKILSKFKKKTQFF